MDTFIKEYSEYGPSLSEYPLIGADILHAFFGVVEQKCSQDGAIAAHEVEPALDLIENYITVRLFPFMCVPARVKNPFFKAQRALSDTGAEPPLLLNGAAASMEEDITEDDEFYLKLKSLSWVEPRHLDIQIPVESEFYERAIECLRNLDNHRLHRSPRAKLTCITVCIRWLAKLLSIDGGGHTAVSGDMLLPALMFLLLKAQPRHLPSTLFYINTFRTQRKSEEEYCLTQLSGAMRYISDILFSTDPRMQAQMATHSGSDGRAGAPSIAVTRASIGPKTGMVAAAAAVFGGGVGSGGTLSRPAPSAAAAGGSGAAKPVVDTKVDAQRLLLQTMLTFPKIRLAIVSCLEVKDILEHVRLVSHQWNTLVYTTLLEQRLERLAQQTLGVGSGAAGLSNSNTTSDALLLSESDIATRKPSRSTFVAPSTGLWGHWLLLVGASSCSDAPYCDL